MSLLKQDITRKKPVNRFSELEPEPDAEENKEYEVKAIQDSAI